MPLFPSKQWCEEAIRLVNADPEAAAAGRGWTGDFGVIVDPDPGTLGRPFVFHCVPDDGRISRFEVLSDPDDLEDIEPAYLARAAVSVWKGLLRGDLDPVEAIIKRRIAIEGDIQPLIERMRYKGIADRVLAGLDTTFADER